MAPTSPRPPSSGAMDCRKPGRVALAGLNESPPLPTCPSKHRPERPRFQLQSKAVRSFGAHPTNSHHTFYLLKFSKPLSLNLRTSTHILTSANTYIIIIAQKHPKSQVPSAAWHWWMSILRAFTQTCIYWLVLFLFFLFLSYQYSWSWFFITLYIFYICIIILWLYPGRSWLLPARFLCIRIEYPVPVNPQSWSTIFSRLRL